MPVYYIDTFGTFQQLGQERVRSAKATQPYRVVRKRVVRKVWGPDETRKLCEGEWEIEERVVCRRVYY